jgi:SAM-dependent methyltransferase
MGQNMGAVASAYTIEDQRRMTRARNYVAWLARLVRPHLGQCVVEVGCGIGNFTAELLGRDVIALDRDPECVEILKTRYPATRSFTREVGRDEIADLRRFQPDSCIFINVLEHIEDDLKALRDVAEILSPGGAIIVLAPAFPSLFGPIDRSLGHYRRYTRASIRKVARSAELRIEKLHYVNLAGFFAWFSNAHILKLHAQSETQIDFFDRYVVPVMERVETKVPPPFGQSLFAVLRKR